MADEIGRIAVNLEPRERIAEDASVREGTLRARRGVDVAQTALQSENLPQPLDVAARERQSAEAGRAGVGSPSARRRWLIPIRREPQRRQQRAEQEGVRER